MGPFLFDGVHGSGLGGTSDDTRERRHCQVYMSFAGSSPKRGKAKRDVTVGASTSGDNEGLCPRSETTPPKAFQFNAYGNLQGRCGGRMATRKLESSTVQWSAVGWFALEGLWVEKLWKW